MNKAIVVSVLALTCMACNKPSEEQTSVSRADTAAHDTAAAAVDHSAHAAVTDSAMPSGTPAVDHSQHSAPQPASGHAGHAAERTTGADRAQHAGHNMPANARRMDGMDHSQHTATQTAERPRRAAADGEAASGATAKIQTLVASLLDDPEVQRRIAADTALARLWQNASVRGVLRVNPTHH